MKLGIRNIEEIRNLNYRKGNNEIYFLETELDEKKEKFKIADAVFEIKVSAWRYEKEKDMIVEEYKCLEEIFEKVSIEKGI